MTVIPIVPVGTLELAILEAAAIHRAHQARCPTWAHRVECSRCVELAARIDAAQRSFDAARSQTPRRFISTTGADRRRAERAAAARRPAA